MDRHKMAVKTAAPCFPMPPGFVVHVRVGDKSRSLTAGGTGMVYDTIGDENRHVTSGDTGVICKKVSDNCP
jgi:hypothetical protein